MRVSEKLKIFKTMMKIFNARSRFLGIKRELYEQVVVAKVTYGVETRSMRIDERL